MSYNKHKGIHKVTATIDTPDFKHKVELMFAGHCDCKGREAPCGRHLCKTRGETFEYFESKMGKDCIAMGMRLYGPTYRGPDGSQLFKYWLQLGQKELEKRKAAGINNPDDTWRKTEQTPAERFKVVREVEEYLEDINATYSATDLFDTLEEAGTNGPALTSLKIECIDTAKADGVEEGAGKLEMLRSSVKDLEALLQAKKAAARADAEVEAKKAQAAKTAKTPKVPAKRTTNKKKKK